MKKEHRYVNDLNPILSDKVYILCITLIVLICYGFAAVNVSVGMDDLEAQRYIGSGMEMLSAGRFTTYLLSIVFGYGTKLPENSFLIDILSILGLIWSAINFCILFRRICGTVFTKAACTIFSCTFVSYPLIHEIWEYTGANLNVSFGFLCDSFALLLVHDILHHTERRLPKLSAATLLMMLVCAGYESLVPVYIFSVFAILALQVVYGTQAEKKVKTIIRQGMCYAIVLAAGLILRVVVHRIILFTLGLEAQSNGATLIFWGTAPALGLLKQLLVLIFRDYILKAMIYFPLTELLVSGILLLIIGLFACRKHGYSLLLPGFGMYLSLILLALLQGYITGYRSCQVFGMFVSFVVTLIVLIAESRGRPGWTTVVLLLCGYLCFSQARYTNYFLTLNHLRSEEEAYVVQDIGTTLQRDFSDEKPVIFVGRYSLSNGIIESASIPEDSLRWKIYTPLYTACDAYLESYAVEPLTRKLPQSNINSVINFGKHAFSQEAMQHLFSYYGFDYILADCDLLQSEADAYVAEHNVPAYPKNGFIQDVGEYIIVHIQ